MKKLMMIAAIGLVFPGHDALGQETPTVQVGSRVRLRTAKGTFVGTVKKIEPGTLTLEPAIHALIENRTVDAIEFPITSIAKIQLGSNHHRHAGKGALIGTGIGMVLGVLASGRSGSGGCGLVGLEPCTAETDVRTMAVGAMSGAAWGSLIGALVVHEDWRDASVDDVRVARRARVSVVASRKGTRLALTIAF